MKIGRGHKAAQHRKAIGARLRLVRHDLSFTQEDLAAATGVPRTHIASVECGRVFPSFELLSMLPFPTINVCLDWFITGDRGLDGARQNPAPPLPAPDVAHDWADNAVSVHSSLLTVQRALAVEIHRISGTPAGALHLETLRCIHAALMLQTGTLLDLIKNNGRLAP